MKTKINNNHVHNNQTNSFPGMFNISDTRP